MKRLIVAIAAACLTMLALVVPLTMGGDDAFYLETANNLLHGCYCVGGQFTSYRPPGYSSWLCLELSQ